VNYGKVIKLSGEIAEVEIRYGDNCSVCEKSDCTGCEDNDKTVVIEAVNSIGAGKGDTVGIEASAKHLFLMAAVVYILPIVLALAVYFAVRLINKNSTAAGIAALAVFAAATALSGHYFKKKASPDTRIKIVRIISSEK